MSVENCVAALLNQAAITTVFGTRIALAQLPQSTDLSKKCLVYSTPLDRPTPNVNHLDGKARSLARVRLTVLGKVPADVVSAHEVLKATLHFTLGGTYGGHRVLSFRKDNAGPLDRNNDLGVWWRPDDYMLAYYD